MSNLSPRQRLRSWSRGFASDTTMRAAVYDRAALEGIRVIATRAPPSPPSKGALLVRVKACGVNPVDAKGIIGDKLPVFLRPLARRFIDGRVVGFDLSGVVEHAPPGSGYAVGDEVYGAVPPFRGSFAELVRVPLDQVARKPASLTHAQAAALVLPGVTVAQLLDQHHFAPGQHVLIIGASGGVGHLAVQIAKARGAIVVAVCGVANEAFVRRLGADEVVPYDAVPGDTIPGDGDGDVTRDISLPGDRNDRVVDRLREIVRARGRPFDLCVDAVSSHDAADASHRYERRVRGASEPKLLADGPDADPHNYVFIGGATREWFLAGLKRLTGIDAFARGRELFWIAFPGCARELGALRELADGPAGVRPTIETTVGLTDEGVREAFRRLHSRRVRGKVVIEV